jgi:hypothetical protein
MAMSVFSAVQVEQGATRPLQQPLCPPGVFPIDCSFLRVYGCTVVVCFYYFLFIFSFIFWWKSEQRSGPSHRRGCAAPYRRALTSPLRAQDMNIPPIMNLASASQVVNRFLAACCDECVTTTHLDACIHCHESWPAWGLQNTGKEALPFALGLVQKKTQKKKTNKSNAQSSTCLPNGHESIIFKDVHQYHPRPPTGFAS